MSMLNTWQDKLNRQHGKLEVLESQLEGHQNTVKSADDLLTTRKEAHRIIQIAAQLTQEKLQEQLGSVVSMALSAVFKNPYEFVVEFVSKRNATECNLWFQREGERCGPLDDAGFGAADITSVALRMSYWKGGSTRPILLIDEPCKNLSKTYHGLASAMFQEMSKKLGIQIILITHIEDFREGADDLFTVSMDRRGASHVEVQS